VYFWRILNISYVSDRYINALTWHKYTMKKNTQDRIYLNKCRYLLLKHVSLIAVYILFVYYELHFMYYKNN